MRLRVDKKCKSTSCDFGYHVYVYVFICYLSVFPYWTRSTVFGHEEELIIQDVVWFVRKAGVIPAFGNPCTLGSFVSPMKFWVQSKSC